MKEFDPGEAPSIASITDRVRALPVGMPATSVHFLGDTAVFVGAEENVGAGQRSGRSLDTSPSTAAPSCARRPTASASSPAATTASSSRSTPRARSTVLATDAKRRWIDNVALHPDGAVAWSAGKTAFVRSGKGEEKSLRCAVDRRRAGVRAKGPARGGRPLQRRDAVVSQHGGEAGISGMGRLASRRHLQPRQQIPGHRDARAGAAWLAACR